MPQYGLMGTLAVYLVLAVLLLSLNIFSLWRWWVKALAIIVTTCCVAIAYFTITSMIGWPAFTALPPRFSVVATHIIEPNRLTGAAGHIYLWVEEINENNVAVGAPRAYELPYTLKAADNTDSAQGKLNSGKKVLGETASRDDGEGKQTGTGKSGVEAGKIASTVNVGAAVSSDTVAAEAPGAGAVVSFSDMPAPEMPDKDTSDDPPAGAAN